MPDNFKRQNVPLCLINTRDCFAFELIIKETVYDIDIPYLETQQDSFMNASRSMQDNDDWAGGESEDIWADHSSHQT